MTPRLVRRVAALLGTCACVAGAAAQAPAKLTVHLYARNAQGAAVPAPNVGIHFTVVKADITTDAKGTASIPLPPAAYQLGTKNGAICTYPFTMPRAALELHLLAVAGQPACEKHPGVPPAAAAPGKPAKP